MLSKFSFLTSLINFSDHFLSAPASYYFFLFLPAIYLYIIIYIIYYYFIFFLIYYYYIFIFVWRPKNRLQQMPPLYNTYGARVLRCKFYKDKQN